jgi:hypothetical protein
MRIAGNIRAVVEMKFKGDTLSDAQDKAYRKIAGEKDKFLVMKEGEDCICKDDDKEKQKKPATQPASQPAPQPQSGTNWSLVAGAALVTVAAVAAALIPFDGPFGEAALGSAALGMWGAAFGGAQ